MMQHFVKTLLGGAALLAAPMLASAQSAPHYLAVPAGFTAVLVPDDAAAPALPMLPDPQAMLQQMDAMIAQAQQSAAAMQAQFISMQAGAAPEAGVVITTISDGAASCTQRITYPGNGAQAQIQLTSTANGCALEGLTQPAAAPKPASPPASNLVIADRD
jgi:hypothetical protein